MKSDKIDTYLKRKSFLSMQTQLWRIFQFYMDTLSVCWCPPLRLVLFLPLLPLSYRGSTTAFFTSYFIQLQPPLA